MTEHPLSSHFLLPISDTPGSGVGAAAYDGDFNDREEDAERVGEGYSQSSRWPIPSSRAGGQSFLSSKTRPSYRRPGFLGLDATVSNRAEAEALVHKTQKEILDLVQFPGEEVISETDRVLLSARLAAY
ncbi:hypothetical protein BD410DRAFT_841591 [Rickenella mellea]|uniref:Uncharacterized protein n=1 Tax=Rickenella mellea TaxID=50990 RepID=A0A4Y7PX86_9AGAM|nr:hypothetical protein BD410DRAFT_841591 [Rickenella mellea]